mgnify:CR=1 FL=1
MKLFALLILLCVCISACGSPGADSSPPFVPNSEARRLVTLSPHLAELVFAVGSGDQLVGVSAYTDFPTEAARLPVIGDAFNLDQEQLTLLAPDVLLAWDTGTPQHVVDELRSRGFVVEVITTTSLSDIPEALKHIGQITGNSDEAGKVATAFESGLAEISEGVNDMSSISVFTRSMYVHSIRSMETISSASLFHYAAAETYSRTLEGLLRSYRLSPYLSAIRTSYWRAAMPVVLHSMSGADGRASRQTGSGIASSVSYTHLTLPTILLV